MAKKKKLINKTLPQRFIHLFHCPYWLAVVLFIALIFRIPSFFEPFSYGDEMIYLTLGNAINKGLVLYRDIHDNKPPLLYFTAALAGNVFWFRIILAFWMLATTTLFWKLVNFLFPKNQRLVQVSVIIFTILTTIPLLEGQISNAELFMLAPTIAAFYLILQKKFTSIKMFFIGLLMSFAALYKIPAAFDLGAIYFILFILLLNGKLKFKSLLKNYFIIAIGFFLPILLSIAYYAAKGAFNEYLVAAFLQNVGYLSSWNRSGQQVPFLVKNGPLLTRGIVLLVGLLMLTAYHKHLKKPFILFSAWLLFSLFAVTLSERPYPHYLIQIVPPVSVMIGYLFTKKTKEQTLVIIPLTLAAFVPVYYNFWHYPTLPYYQRFAKFALGQQSKEQYFDNFDGNVNRNYAIAEFLVSSTKPSDRIFIWYDGAPIYALSRRLPPFKYVAGYHINDFSSPEDVLNMIKTKKPEMVIILPGSPIIPGLNSTLENYYLNIDNVDGARIWKLTDPIVMRAFR